MINSVSSSAPVNQYSQQIQQTSHPPKPKKAEPPQDSVVLSQKAKAAAGDPDHDGD
jgi:hypothetical protein